MTHQRPAPIRVEAPQRSDEWYKARLGRLTASECKDIYYDVSDQAIGAAMRKILGVERLTTAVKASDAYLKLEELNVFELFDRAEMDLPETAKRMKLRQETVAERITNMPADPDGFTTNDMKWGIINENYAIALYQMEQKVIVDTAPLMLHPKLKAGASPDGLATDMKTGELGNIEVKCLRSANHLYKIIDTQEMPDDYKDQVQMQMWITGRDWCDFIGYDSRVPNGLKIFVQRIPYDVEYAENTMIPAIERFLWECDRDEKRFRARIREQEEAKK